MSKDPTRFRGGLNLYGYAYGDPINYVDRDGRNPLVAIGLGIGAFAAGFAAGSWYYFDWKTSNDATDTGLKGSIDGPQDAYRHCLVACRLTNSYGKKVAKTLCESHEDTDDHSPAAEMDRSNNDVGISYGSSDRSSCEEQCMAGINENTLQWLPTWRY